jgi:hypothetical protein
MILEILNRRMRSYTFQKRNPRLSPDHFQRSFDMRSPNRSAVSNKNSN